MTLQTTAVARQWLSSNHVVNRTDTIVRELLLFSHCELLLLEAGS
jgi:hypothetical protein